MSRKKVFVSGCFDMLHSGHVAFLEEAATYGDLYVGIGSDATIRELKARKTINTEQERLYMLKALKAVKDAWINSGRGMLDFLSELEVLQPDIFFVNEDGDTLQKRELCQKYGIEYIVSRRKPHGQLPTRSTTALRTECSIPYRIDLAGGWLDQPQISALHSGMVITASIEPDYEFNDRSGMATSTRNKAIELWHTHLPVSDRETMARTLFCFENPPGKTLIAGSQDAIGIVYPGINMLNYAGDYWPHKVESILEEDTLSWLEKHIYLLALEPRPSGYDVYKQSQISVENVQRLSLAAKKCAEAIRLRNVVRFGESVRESFEAQLGLFPQMASEELRQIIQQQTRDCLGYKLTGAGGGGYILCVSEKGYSERGIRIRIRRS